MGWVAGMVWGAGAWGVAITLARAVVLTGATTGAWMAVGAGVVKEGEKWKVR
jgi:hypothetical protein